MAFVQMPNYQTDGIKAYKPGLDNIIRLCEYFGNPQKELKMIHIGGTNGKDLPAICWHLYYRKKAIKLDYTTLHILFILQKE